MTKTNNKAFRAPSFVMTETMMAAGLDAFTQMAADPENFSDRSVVEGIYRAVWEAYWHEIEATRKKKTKGSPIIKPSGLILPPHG